MTISQLLEKRNTTDISMNILITGVNNKMSSQSDFWMNNLACDCDCDFNCDCGGNYHSANCDCD